MGGAMVGLPLLDYFSKREARAADLPKRIVFITTPNGTDPAVHWPTGTQTDFTLGPILAPLEAYHARMMVLRGVDNRAATATGINGHTDSVRCMFTGRIAANFDNTDYTAGGGISVDQHIANDIGATTAFKSLEVLTDYIYAQGANYASFYGAGQPVPFEDEPDKLFDRVFADFQVPADDPVVVARRQDRQSVLHSVYDQYTALQPRLGAADRMRLEAHLAKVHDLEARILDTTTLNCEIPTAPASCDSGCDSSAGLDVLVHALACDLTRVASVRLCFWDSYEFLGVTGSYHDDYLHFVTDNATAAATVQMVKNWQAQQVAAFVDRLVATPEGEGTIFDNTLVVWADEFCHGYAHAHNEVPYVLLCGSDRFFPMGRFIHYTDAVSNNQLWNALIAAMDAQGAGSFGDAQFDNTPLDLS
jgi:hypothetical protein